MTVPRQEQVAELTNPVRVGDFVVEGDGTPDRTVVYHKGERVAGVQKITWNLGVKEKSTLTLTIVDTRKNT